MSTEILNDIEKKFVAVVTKALNDVEMSREPEELNKFRKLFKKHVPLTKRSYVAAYLARQAVTGDEKTEVNSYSHTSKTPHSPHQGKPKIVLSEEEAQVLFLSVGRKRGTGPKDIITLIMQNVEIPREHIGEIKILDNYCFVQVKKENADSIIEKLNNFRYRGRSLSASYATSKPEKNEAMFSGKETEDGQNSEERDGKDEEGVLSKEQ